MTDFFLIAVQLDDYFCIRERPAKFLNGGAENVTQINRTADLGGNIADGELGDGASVDILVQSGAIQRCPQLI